MRFLPVCQWGVELLLPCPSRTFLLFLNLSLPLVELRVKTYAYIYIYVKKSLLSNWEIWAMSVPNNLSKYDFFFLMQTSAWFLDFLSCLLLSEHLHPLSRVVFMPHDRSSKLISVISTVVSSALAQWLSVRINTKKRWSKSPPDLMVQNNTHHWVQDRKATLEK